jgi:hypothetical protein
VQMDRAMLCALLYSVKERFQGELAKSFEDQVDEVVKQRHSTLQWQVTEAEKRYKQLKEKVDAYEKASGVSIPMYEYGDTIENIGAAVRQVMDGGSCIEDHKRTLESLHRQAERVAHNLASEIAELAAQKPNPPG